MTRVQVSLLSGTTNNWKSGKSFDLADCQKNKQRKGQNKCKHTTKHIKQRKKNKQQQRKGHTNKEMRIQNGPVATFGCVGFE